MIDPRFTFTVLTAIIVEFRSRIVARNAKKLATKTAASFLVER